MFKVEHLSDSLLKRFAMELPKGQFLFKQGEKGNTLYILIEGEVELYHKTLTSDRMVGVLRAGEIIGERALLSATPYKRNVSVVARTEVTLLQFDHQALKLIQTNMPDFTSKLLGSVIERLERANELLSILQQQSALERATLYLVFAATYFGTKTPVGIEITIVPDEVTNYINVEVPTIKAVLAELVALKLIQHSGDKVTIPNTDALLQYAPTLKDNIAA